MAGIIEVKDQGKVRIYDADNSNYVDIVVPSTVSANRTITIPDATFTIPTADTVFSASTITGQSAETSVADDDLVVISDTSASGALKKMTKANFVGSTGKLLQVATATMSTEREINSSSFVSSQLTVNITPSASSSKIFIICSGALDTGAADRLGFMTIYRDSTNVGGSGSSGISGNYASGSTRLNTPFGIHVLDSPNTTSQITYGLFVRANNTGTIKVNAESETAHITVMEIAG